jgi:hypothetical protein
MTDHCFTDEGNILLLLKWSDDLYANVKLSPEEAKTLLALINRQKAEIERLNKEVDRLSQCVLYHDGIVSDLEKDLFNAKSEATKEFSERLKANMSNIARMEYGGNTYFCVGYDLIDTLVKEMTEGK